MSLTKEQKAARKNRIGASDVSAIVGVNPWQSAYDIWLEKTDRLEDKGEERHNEAVTLGNDLEPVLLDYAERELGVLDRNVEVQSRELRYLVSTLDGQVRGTREPVEAKTAGLLSFRTAEWGEPGTDEIPMLYLVQAHIQLHCTNTGICHVPALLGGRGYAMYSVLADPELEEDLLRKIESFWLNNVQADTPPPDVLPSMESLKRVRRRAEKVVELSPHVVSQWRETVELLKKAEKEEDSAKKKVLLALGDAEAGIMLGSQAAITYYEQKRKAYAVKEVSFRALRYTEKGL